jgi:S1-C subfamily serine protease
MRSRKRGVSWTTGTTKSAGTKAGSGGTEVVIGKLSRLAKRMLRVYSDHDYNGEAMSNDTTIDARLAALGDVLTALDGQALTTPETLRLGVNTASPGQAASPFGATRRCGADHRDRPNSAGEPFWKPDCNAGSAGSRLSLICCA